MKFVLDKSIFIRWLLKDREPSTQDYARKVLDLLIEGGTALVPNLWALEAANVIVIVKALKKGTVTQADASQFIALLGELDIQPDAQTHDHALGDTLSLAKQYGLSSYDAAYLELALRKGTPLATVDKELGDAASKAGGLRVLMN
jgi:predicted nucleic acid-binding protein